MLKVIGAKNFKSFDEKGIFIDDLNKINIFIGKNNSGKSNVLELLRFLKTCSKKYFNFNEDKEKNTSIYRTDIKFIGKDNKTANNSFEFIVRIQATNIFGSLRELEKVYSDNVLLEFTISLPNFSIEKSSLERLDDQSICRIINLSARKLDATSKNIIFKDLYERLKTGLKNNISDNYFDKIIYIPQFREITKRDQEKKERNPIIINGNNIIEELKKLQHPSPFDRSKDKFIELQKIISNYLDQDIELEISHDDEIIITLDGKRLPLKSLGTGIHELVIISAAIVTNTDNIFCIEEPEIHMHPELQRKFLEFIKSSENSQFFITTHSNIFIDNSENTNVYHVTHDGISSKINKVTFKTDSYQVLDDLGYKASDILQTNFIIWVEGPSDRIYLKKWIECYCDNEGIETLIEGLHHSFLFYGGSNLSYFSIFNENYENQDNLNENFIDILSNCRNAIVFCDSDKESSRKHLKPRVKKLKDKITDLENKNKGTNKYIDIIITDGKEIENYIPHNLLLKVLSSDKFKKKYFLKPRKIEIICTPEKISNIFSKYDKFNDFFSNMYFYKNNRKLNPAKKGEIANYYNQKKVKIARKVAEEWTSENFSDELKEKIKTIVKGIRIANGMELEEKQDK